MGWAVRMKHTDWKTIDNLIYWEFKAYFLHFKLPIDLKLEYHVRVPDNQTLYHHHLWSKSTQN